MYAAGHGIAGIYQEMILNGTSANKFALERNLRDICLWAGKRAHVFAVFDMCKSDPLQYPGLTFTGNKEIRGFKDAEQPLDDTGFSFHAISAAELASTTRADSKLGRELKKLIISAGKKGFEIPISYIQIDGVPTQAKKAPIYKVALSNVDEHLCDEVLDGEEPDHTLINEIEVSVDQNRETSAPPVDKENKDQQQNKVRRLFAVGAILGLLVMVGATAAIIHFATA